MASPGAVSDGSDVLEVSDYSVAEDSRSSYGSPADLSEGSSEDEY